MEDFLVTAIGRSLIELSAQREQLHQALKQAQAEIAELKKPAPPPQTGL